MVWKPSARVPFFCCRSAVAFVCLYCGESYVQKSYFGILFLELFVTMFIGAFVNLYRLIVIAVLLVGYDERDWLEESKTRCWKWVPSRMMRGDRNRQADRGRLVSAAEQ